MRYILTGGWLVVAVVVAAVVDAGSSLVAATLVSAGVSVATASVLVALGSVTVLAVASALVPVVAFSSAFSPVWAVVCWGSCSCAAGSCGWGSGSCCWDSSGATASCGLGSVTVASVVDVGFSVVAAFSVACSSWACVATAADSAAGACTCGSSARAQTGKRPRVAARAIAEARCVNRGESITCTFHSNSWRKASTGHIVVS